MKPLVSWKEKKRKELKKQKQKKHYIGFEEWKVFIQQIVHNMWVTKNAGVGLALIFCVHKGLSQHVYMALANVELIISDNEHAI